MPNTEYYTSDRKELAPFIPPVIKRSLDVGCASGVFSFNLKKEKSHEAWGIEMKKDVAEIAKSRLDKVLIGSFEEVRDALPKDYFDCIFFNDVLEHMPYPEDCLSEIKKNLSPDGCIVASIPNMRQIGVLRELIFKKDWEYKESGIMDKTHLRFFTKKSIIRMFEKCGYEVHQIKGINSISPFCLTSLLNIVAFNRLEDLKYSQYAVVAAPIK